MTFEYQLHTIERIKHTQHQPHARIFVRNSRVGDEHLSIVTVFMFSFESLVDQAWGQSLFCLGGLERRKCERLRSNSDFTQIEQKKNINSINVTLASSFIYLDTMSYPACTCALDLFYYRSPHVPSFELLIT